jgi:hypothetical protein
VGQCQVAHAGAVAGMSNHVMLHAEWSQAAAAAEVAPEPEDIPPPSSPLRERLDYRPRLTNRQVASVRCRSLQLA